MTKKDFSYFWDDLADDRGARRRYEKVMMFIKKYDPKSKSILELGVGNGNVLKHFSKKYDLHGLDIDKKYIELSKKKIPRANLFVASMHNFKVKRKFDVIFSVYDSLNFLKNLEQWKKTFKNVNKHLEKEGLFIFDFYTPKMLEKAKKWDIFSKEKFGFMQDKGVVKGKRLTWHFSIFEKQKRKNFVLHEYDFHEWIFPVNQVEREIYKNFRILEKLDGETLSRPTKDTFRLLYVCKTSSVNLKRAID
ncbi:class I SAM-dependent methyltransferase [Candidatus Woesearchaeota archaeon]|nr:class I SAM-dependent methyltransferase [Candidatus Woesearchaeota archaeon]